MAKLKRSFERAGFKNVRTVLSSGNVMFDARTASQRTLARKAGVAIERELGRSFYTIVRPVQRLRELLTKDPYAGFRLPWNAKRVVTFLGEPRGGKLSLPLRADGARILAVRGREVLTAYVPSRRGAVFMQLIEKTFGSHVTTRTWDTVKRCAEG